MLGDVKRQDKNADVFLEAEKIIKNEIEKRNVIFDATNINYKRRIEFINKFEKYCKKIYLCFVWASYEECLERNAKRERKVPEEVIKRMYMNFDIPQIFEENYLNGKVNSVIYFNSNIIIDNIDWNKLERKMNISHDNPHHKLSILDHCLKARDYFDDGILKLAAYLHDIGKPFCKTFINGKGEKTEIAHYYNHEKVGAYDSIPYILNYTLKNVEIYKYPYWYAIYISNLIRWHMLLHSELSEKSIEKYKEKFGKIFWKDLNLLHKADLNAD